MSYAKIQTFLTKFNLENLENLENLWEGNFVGRKI